MLRAIDLVLRVLYVAIAPMLLAMFAVLFPITGTMVGAGLATLVALIGGDRWHLVVDRIPVLGRILGGMSRLGDFYREHPPKPLIYYVLYPLLLPVILFMRIPRREFLLYRKLNIIALVVVIATGALDYFRHWQPELPFKLFVTSMIVGFILQLFVTFMLVMPIVTTLLGLRVRGYMKSVAAVALLVALSFTAGIAASHRMRGGMQMSTYMRIRARTHVSIADARRCLAEHPSEAQRCKQLNRAFISIVEGLNEVYIWLRDHPGDTDTALDRARDKLAEYYKPDEADAFHLYVDEGIYMLYVRYGKNDKIYLARDARQIITDLDKLPPGAQKVLER